MPAKETRLKLPRESGSRCIQPFSEKLRDDGVPGPPALHKPHPQSHKCKFLCKFTQLVRHPPNGRCSGEYRKASLKQQKTKTKKGKLSYEKHKQNRIEDPKRKAHEPEADSGVACLGSGRQRRPPLHEGDHLGIRHSPLSTQRDSRSGLTGFGTVHPSGARRPVCPCFVLVLCVCLILL